MLNVEFGKCYKAGPHLFRCGDLLEPSHWRELIKMFNRKVNVVYSDPPWNAGNLGYWRTHAGYPKAKQNWTEFIDRWTDSVSLINPDAIYCEQSINDPDTVTLAIRGKGLPTLDGSWVVRYGAPVNTSDRMSVCKRPNLLLRFARHNWGGNPTELSGEPMTAHVFDHEPLCVDGNVVADPCVGKGMTVRQAHRIGMACVGMELNPSRLQVTIDWLAKQDVKVEAC